MLVEDSGETNVFISFILYNVVLFIQQTLYNFLYFFEFLPFLRFILHSRPSTSSSIVMISPALLSGVASSPWCSWTADLLDHLISQVFSTRDSAQINYPTTVECCKTCCRQQLNAQVSSTNSPSDHVLVACLLLLHSTDIFHLFRTLVLINRYLNMISMRACTQCPI